MPGRYAFSPEQSHNSRHGSDTGAANEYMNHLIQPQPGAFGLLRRYFLRPSCRHIRSTRLWFALHPSFLSIAVILRYP